MTPRSPASTRMAWLAGNADRRTRLSNPTESRALETLPATAAQQAHHHYHMPTRQAGRGPDGWRVPKPVIDGLCVWRRRRRACDSSQSAADAGLQVASRRGDATRTRDSATGQLTAVAAGHSFFCARLKEDECRYRAKTVVLGSFCHWHAH